MSPETCQRCGATDEVDDVVHWMKKCEATLAARQINFGNTEIGMVELALQPAKTIKLARKTIVNRAPQQA